MHKYFLGCCSHQQSAATSFSCDLHPLMSRLTFEHIVHTVFVYSVRLLSIYCFLKDCSLLERINNISSTHQLVELSANLLKVYKFSCDTIDVFYCSDYRLMAQ